MYELISECQWSKKEILEVIEALQEKIAFTKNHICKNCHLLTIELI